MTPYSSRTFGFAQPSTTDRLFRYIRLRPPCVKECAHRGSVNSGRHQLAEELRIRIPPEARRHPRNAACWPSAVASSRGNLERSGPRWPSATRRQLRRARARRLAVSSRRGRYRILLPTSMYRPLKSGWRSRLKGKMDGIGVTLRGPLLQAAQCSGVRPSESRAFGSAPMSRQAWTSIDDAVVQSHSVFQRSHCAALIAVARPKPRQTATVPHASCQHLLEGFSARGRYPLTLSTPVDSGVQMAMRYERPEVFICGFPKGVDP